MLNSITSAISRWGWVALSLGWLIPNHYQPWPSFYLEAWVGFFLLIVNAPIIWNRFYYPEPLFDISLVSIALIFVPWIQHCFGLIPFFADAVVSMVYLAGFALATVVGCRFEQIEPFKLAESLFISILIAAILSLGLQLCQMLGVDGMDFLLMGPGFGRPAANVGQANHLATLFLWGVIAATWLNTRGVLSGLLTIIIVACLFFGIALSLSRTAWIGLVILFICLSHWRRFFGERRVFWLTIGMVSYFLLCLIAVAWVNRFILEETKALHGVALLRSVGGLEFTRHANELRPVIWRLFIDAILNQPLWGYGWNQGNQVQMQMVMISSSLHVLSAHAHNFFLDLMAWNGIPLGILIIIVLLRWFWRMAKAIKTVEEVLLFSMLLVLGNHAMLELPMNYIYFLLPAALVIGVLNARLNMQIVVIRRYGVIQFFWLLLLLITVIYVRDYSLIERAERNLRIEIAGFKSAFPPDPPETWLLNQWREVYRFAYMRPREDVDDDTLKWARNVVTYSYSPRAIFQLSTLLALNDRPEEAELWLKRLCNQIAVEECKRNKLIWMANSDKNQKISLVRWPD